MNKTLDIFLEGQYLLMIPHIKVSPTGSNWSTSTPHFLVEFRMAVRMILSLLKLVRTFVRYSKKFKNKCTGKLTVSQYFYIENLCMKSSPDNVQRVYSELLRVTVTSFTRTLYLEAE